MTIKLYWTLMSQPSRAVKTVLQIAKIQHNLQQINLMTNQTQSKEYISTNPLGQIPFIADNNFSLGQSSAILIYLCQKYPQKLGYLYGKDLKQKAKINQFLSSYQSVFRPVMFKILFLKVYKSMAKKQPIYIHEINNAKKQITVTLTELQNVFRMSNTLYLAGNSPSIADILYFQQITNLTLYEISLQSFNLVKQWFYRLLNIQELKKLHQEWLELTPGFIKILNKIPILQKSKL